MKNLISKLKTETLIIAIIIILGFILRLSWNPHQIIWSYDQARDSFMVRDFFINKHLPIIGPQAEQYGLFHGPLYYWIMIPIYGISNGETFLPILIITIMTFISVIPLYLLSIKITNNKLAGIFTLFTFSLSYEFIEYSRWLSNVTITLPFLAWSYFFLYKVINQDKSHIRDLFLLGLFIGLAIQGELFFLSLLVVFFLTLIIKKIDFKGLVSYSVGGILGMAPIIIAQFKFNFMGAKILSNVLINGSQQATNDAGKAITGYINHLGLTTYQTVGGLSEPMGLFIFILGLILVFKIQKKSAKYPTFIIWLLTILLSHALLFTFSYVDTVFVDLGLTLLLVIMAAIVACFLWGYNRILFISFAVFFLIFQLILYKSYLIDRKPFGEYNFVQPTSTLSDLDDIVNTIYKYTNGRPFTFDSIGTPFGVRTVWASVFELHYKETGIAIPDWYGFTANGYPGDYIFKIAAHPEKLHVLVLESNIDILLPKSIISQELENQDTHTKIISEVKVNDTIIQFRESIED